MLLTALSCLASSIDIFFHPLPADHLYLQSVFVVMSMRTALSAAAVAIGVSSTGAENTERRHCTGVCQEPHEKYGSPRMYGVMEEKRLVTFILLAAVTSAYVILIVVVFE